MSAAKTGCAVVVMGVSGSGKTTVAELLAKQLGWRFVEGDRLHPPANVEKMKQGVALTDADRAPWLDRIGEELRSWATAGQSGVLTCSALKRAYRDILVHGRSDVRIVYLNGTQELIASRLAERKGHFMPSGLLASQFATLEPPDAEENPVTVSIDGSVDTIIDDIVRGLGLSARPDNHDEARTRP